MVMTQETMMSLMVLRLSASIPRANPTPKTAPTSVCVAEMGMPNREATKRVRAAPNSAANPRAGVVSVNFLPLV